MFKNLFKRNRKTEEDFFALDTKYIGKFVEFNHKTGYRHEFEFTANEQSFVGAWICEAKARNNDYSVVIY